MINKEKAIIILSGGMDSTTLLYDIVNQGYDVTAISFDYGQKHIKELNCATKTCEKLKVKHVKLPLGGLVASSALTNKDAEIPEGHYADENMKLTVVPNRNMTMLVTAATYAVSIGAKKLFYGVHSGDHAIYCDCRPEFVEAMKKAILLSDDFKVELEAPYSNIDKGDIAIIGKELGVDYSLTTTCYKGGEKACGKCGSCVERLEAFEKAGVEDPVEYEK